MIISRLDSEAARQAVDRSVIVPHNCHYNQNGWLKYDHRVMYKKHTNPLPSYGMWVVERHLEMAQPSKKLNWMIKQIYRSTNWFHYIDVLRWQETSMKYQLPLLWPLVTMVVCPFGHLVYVWLPGLPFYRLSGQVVVKIIRKEMSRWDEEATTTLRPLQTFKILGTRERREM